MRGLSDTDEGLVVDEGSAQVGEGRRQVMGIRAAARLMGVSEDTVRRWIDANEPSRDHPDRVPVAERARKGGGPIAGRWRRPFRDAVEEEAARRRGGQAGGDEGAAGRA